MHIIRMNEIRTPTFDLGGERLFELLNASDACGRVQKHSMILLELDPGCASPAEPHFHKQSEETYIILSGTATMWIEGKAFNLEAGDVAVAGVGEKHQIIAEGDGPLRCLAVMADPFDAADVFV